MDILVKFRSQYLQDYLGYISKANGNIDFVIFYDWPNLKLLRLSDNHINLLGLKSLIEISFPNLKTLYLDENNIGGRGAKLLQKTSLLLMLKKLVLSKCHLASEGLKHLSKIQWKNLEILDVQCNEISLDGIFSIAEMMDRWIKLSELSTNKVVQKERNIKVKSLQTFQPFSSCQ